MALGYCAFEEGFIESATSHFQKALSTAERIGDLRAICSCQLRLMNVLADRSGHQAVAPLLAQVRRNVIRLGDSVTSAALHISIGELEAKRGFVGQAARHTTLGQNLLQKDGNIYLDGVSENTLMAVAIIRCDPFAGIDHGNRAVRLAEESGSSSLRRAALGNLGNLYLLTGQFALARQYLDLAKNVPPTTGALSNGALESLAVLALVEGRLEDAAALLEEIKASIRTQSDWMIYANRNARLTLVEMMAREGRLNEALQEVERVVELGELSGDRRLHINALLTKAELLVMSGWPDDSISILRRTVDALTEHPPDTYARYQRAVGMAFLGLGHTDSAGRFFRRSKRTYEGLHNVCGRLELVRVWEDGGGKTEVDISPQLGNADNLLQNTAALLLHAGRPELVGTGLIAILEDVGGIVSATAVSKGADGSSETLATFGDIERAGGHYFDHAFDLGAARGRSVEVRIRLCNDIQSIATLNAITLLLGTIRNLERANIEREERLTLWPIDEVPQDGEQAVMLGQLSELMSYARRVAGTNVNILITGESGTGKEILARAIHRYSSRAHKPFLPFNCSAIPREMLESQLFGHRRGAFTGADRDNLGVIRAARDGTLLLDEVGELSPELQPKLLRFLESGEISPLGDPNPLTVDVRIIASTNANLEQLVQEGRFRDDLFYRLNVIRLTVPPLRERRDEIPALAHHFVARAAQEFGKSRLRLTEETMEHLILYSWPGNVRQLSNELRRVVALADSDSTITPSALSKEILRSAPRVPRGNLAPEICVALTDKLVPALAGVEREMIKAALKTSDGKVDAAARALGISRKGLYLKRRRLGL
jgi:DNA-binding NtrC family response regulator/tetratricopeptide (TPR) repeat protein